MRPYAKIGILLSGRGSNFLALHRAIEQGRLDAEIVAVISNLSEAPGLRKARELGLPVKVIAHRGLKRKEHEKLVATALKASQARWVCLAGYMRLLGQGFIQAFDGKVLNIHPSLLPSFPGLQAQKQAWDYGVRVTGCTVHFVDDGMDTGPIVAQRAVEVSRTMALEDLTKKILVAEHALYAATLQRLLTEKWAIEQRRVIFGDSFQEKG